MLTAKRPTDRISNDNFLQALLQEQSDLSAVERFTSYHASQTEATDQPAQAKFYQALLPASAPAPGQQYAFQVDLDACSGCKSCVVACHTLNGLEEDESWRRVGILTTPHEEPNASLPQIRHVTTACHHCENPGCLTGCPVMAYDKDPVTGIVRHLDDQCIGCKYCTLMCPYEVPQYSERLGIVRKCDMCHQRLAVGEAPACVQSCPNEAISIRLVDTERDYDSEDRLVSGAPPSHVTSPTTVYVGTVAEQSSSADPQDRDLDPIQESHWPLVWMLVATQGSVGLLVAQKTLETLQFAVGKAVGESLLIPVAALALALLGLGLAPLHLGQPLRAWRVFLGLRTSWLSREAILLGKYVGALTLTCIVLGFTQVSWDQSWSIRIPSWLPKAGLWMSLLLGVLGLISSGMIYVATARPLWNISQTFPRFIGSSLVIGFVGAAAINSSMLLCACGLIVTLAKLSWEWRHYLAPQFHKGSNQAIRSRRLVHSDGLKHLRSLRLCSAGIGLGLVAAAILCLSLNIDRFAGFAMIASLVSLFVGEIAERILYFSSVVFDRMPGTLH